MERKLRFAVAGIGGMGKAHIEGIRRIAAAFENIPVVIDEAYMDFSREQSAVSLIGEYKTLYVTKTLSKAYGMAGIRLGFLISSKENMKPLKQSFVPYALNSVSMKIACVILKHADEFQAQMKEIIAERERMYAILSGYRRLHIYPSQANFLYGCSADKERMLQMLSEKQIVIRNYKGTDAFRITVGTPAENGLILKVLKAFEEEL